MRGKPFTLDHAVLAQSGVGTLLALDPTAIGSTMSLPAELRATEYVSDALSYAEGGASPQSPQGAKPNSLVAVVSIDGPLEQRGQDHFCGVTDGYDRITQRVTDALNDPAVGSVVLRINSPGGVVPGLEEATRRLRANVKRSGKKVIAFADEFAASAAYWLSTVADEIVLPPMGQVGSIGTIAMYADETGALEKEGIKVTIVRDPEGKAPTHSLGPVHDVALATIGPVHDVALATIQASVADSTNRFTAAVSKRRPMTEHQIRSLNGQMLRGQQAVEAGLADRVGSFEDAISIGAQSAKERRRSMSNSKALTALGLTEEATDEQIAQAAQLTKLGQDVQTLTGKGDPSEALATVSAYQESHNKAAEERAALVKEREALEAKEMAEDALRLLKAGWETPATAWEMDEEGKPVAGKLSANLKAMGAKALKARADTLCAQPRGHATPKAEPAPADGVQTFIVDGHRVDLGAVELDGLKALKADPYAYAAIKLRQGRTQAVNLSK
jgi:ClpP class serine protease